MELKEGDIVRVEGGDGNWVVTEAGKVFIELASEDFEWIQISVTADEVIEVVE